MFLVPQHTCLHVDTHTQVAGGEGISVTQPMWSKTRPGVLYYVSDESDWWNLYAEESPGKVCDCDMRGYQEHRCIVE